MRIGIFTDTWTPQINGVVTSIQLMDSILRAHGHETFIFTLTHPGSLPHTDPPNVFRVPSVRFYGNSDHRIGAIYSRTAMEQARHLHLDIIHSHAPFSLGVFGHISARRLGVPEVHTYHTMLEDYTHYVSQRRVANEAAKRLARRYSRVFCNWSTAVIVPTPKVKETLLSYGVTRPISVLPTPVDLDRFRPMAPERQRQELRRSLGLPEAAPLLLFVGRLAKEKSIDVLIRWHREVRKHLPHSGLVIVGDGDERTQLEACARHLGLGASVHFLGPKPWNELPLYYQAADVFVTASRSETQGLVVPEALACGTPVVAADDPAYHDFIVPGRNGYLFQTAADYVAQLQYLLTLDPIELQRWTRGSVERLSMESFYEQLNQVYETAAALGPAISPSSRSRVLARLRRR